MSKNIYSYEPFRQESNHSNPQSNIGDKTHLDSNSVSVSDSSDSKCNSN